MICSLCKNEVKISVKKSGYDIYTSNASCRCIGVDGIGCSEGDAARHAKRKFEDAIKRMSWSYSPPQPIHAAKWKRKALRLKRARLYN